MSQQTEFIVKENGGFQSLGWARMVTKFMQTNVTLKLYNNTSFYGKLTYKDYPEGFTFSPENCPSEIYDFISRDFFLIKRQNKANQVNFSPAVIQALGRNGLFVNNLFVDTNKEQILKHGDLIKLSPSQTLFQFLDDREYEVRNIPQKVLQKYHMDSYIGKGGQSTVRLVHEIVSSGKFAMKLITKEKFLEETSHSYSKRLQHMQDEVKIMRALHHPNVIKFEEFYESSLDLIIIMELAEGGNLLDYMMKFPRKFLPEQEAKYCFYQIAKGLQHIHALNIAHRDLKVENIFVVNAIIGSRKDVVLKIGDFGYAKNADNLVTQLGTPCYFPPEIQENHQNYTISADIWTLGCLFFACLSGAFPFHADYGSSVAYQISTARLCFDLQPQWKQVSSIIKRF